MVNNKNILVLSVLGALTFSCSQSNTNKQTEFYVRGNCGMCEERIEKTVSALPGVIKADWSVETKNMSVSYDTTKVDEAKIHQAIANSGHETKLVQSPKEAHDALPECCKKGANM
jgi:mercuric ion binding protein